MNVKVKEKDSLLINRGFIRVTDRGVRSLTCGSEAGAYILCRSVGVPHFPPHHLGLMALASGPKDQLLPSSSKRGQSHLSGTGG